MVNLMKLLISFLTTVVAPAVKCCRPQNESPYESTVEYVQENQISEENKVGLHTYTKPAWKKIRDLIVLREITFV